MPPTPPLLAFAHAGLFWTGLGLVAVPILIHYFFRRRHRVVRWAAMDFLLAALRKQKRRMEIENLILLLLRCAAILLLAVAVARPAWNAPALPFGGSARGVVLVVDTSASMGALFTGRSAFDRAKERAAQFLSELPEGSMVTLVASRDETAGGGPRAVLENAERADARAALAGVRLSSGGNRLEAVFGLAREKLKALRGRRLIVLVTDLQRRDWHEQTDTRIEGVYRKLTSVEAGETAPPVVLVDIGQAETANVVVTGLTAERGRGAFPNKLVDLSATLVNYGPAPVQGTLTLQISPPGDGPWEKAGDAQEVTLPPPPAIGQPEPFECLFMPRVPAKGDESVRFRALFTARADVVDRDRLATDSERLLALPVRPPIRVLPVRTYSNALEVLLDVELVQVIEFLQPIYPQDLLAYDLSGVDVVLWADPETPALAAEDVTKLEGFVRRGGGFLAYFGQNADEKQLAHFVDGKADPLLPARIGIEVDHEQHPTRIDREDEHTQAHTLFKETEQALFRSPLILGYVQVSGYAPEAVVAKYENGDPAVLEKRYGRGRVVIVTTTPDPRLFDLDGSLLPVAFFYNATQYLVLQSPDLRNVDVGTPVDIVLPPGTREVEVTPPASVGGPSREPVGENAQEFRLADTSAPGFYRVAARGGGAAAPPSASVDIAVNVDPDEGDLRRVTVDELKRAYQGAPIELADEGDEVLPRVVRGDAGESSRVFLGAVVALLFIELLCAWRFGSRRRPNA